MSDAPTASSVVESNGDTSKPNGSSSKPRARLGETQVVHLPNSDSEDDDEDERDMENGEDGDGTEALKSFPAGTEVRDRTE